MVKYGSAAGALALARSYDPAYVPKSAVSAPAPDLAEARKWYERAAELGDADAKRRLTEIALGG
jgi:TPR repeat protein